MTTLYSPSSAMENTNHRSKKNQRRRRPSATPTNNDYSDVEDAEDGDPEAWQTLNKSFRQVQSVLDRNRAIIQQVNENQQSRMPDNMVKNMGLIQELNENISRVSSLYSDLNSDFTNICHQQQCSSHNRGK